ncbi:MAG: sigma-70 family RNA polymerase sigma factor [Phycisphaerae bacterium]|jgi:RNA polymerase sigma factor (TIGR02999 family)|nr:sigma-70 family RNA polymerase sigma factor [Phycisphaerae bacterium]MCZ2399737.1 sigma-70 family RNA polymerase sigma factor [Phycisphaerae bacterium]NUQ49176.1 sigma-70 family RNA polymerase sigma factor [Phycisphaerae bacterium]
MSHVVQGQVTQLLELARQGDDSAAARLMPLVYEELRNVARGLLAAERPGHTLQATALVHEAYLRLVSQSDTRWEGRVHFFAVAARMLRRILVDHARGRNADKRGGGAARLTLMDGVERGEPGYEPLDLLALDEAMDELERCDERQARVVELRFFAGLDVEETAQALGVSPRTVKDDWRFAKAWLRAQLTRNDPS